MKREEEMGHLTESGAGWNKVRQYRQGDLLLEEAELLPRDARPFNSTVVAYGEVTGHAHRFDLQLDTDVRLYEDSAGRLWVLVSRPARLVHEEHADLTIEPGIYRSIPQREYAPEAIRYVVD